MERYSTSFSRCHANMPWGTYTADICTYRFLDGVYRLHRRQLYSTYHMVANSAWKKIYNFFLKKLLHVSGTIGCMFAGLLEYVPVRTDNDVFITGGVQKSGGRGPRIRSTTRTTATRNHTVIQAPNFVQLRSIFFFNK